jgi:DegV family protein with EDD domain
MAEIGIVTDNTAQFTRPNFVGRERVHVIPFRLAASGGRNSLIPPQEADFASLYARLGERYDAVLVITLTSFFYPLASIARRAMRQAGHNHLMIQVIDSQNISLGLGMLVQLAAAAASAGESLAAMERLIRHALSNVYMLFCVPALEHLVAYGCLSRAQAIVGEMLSWLPLFVLEEGRLLPLQKVRASRYLGEAFQEYLSEFADPERIGFLYGQRHQACYTRTLREFVRLTFPRASFEEYLLESPVRAMLGEETLALAVMERDRHDAWRREADAEQAG